MLNLTLKLWPFLYNMPIMCWLAQQPALAGYGLTLLLRTTIALKQNALVCITLVLQDLIQVKIYLQLRNKWI